MRKVDLQAYLVWAGILYHGEPKQNRKGPLVRFLCYIQGSDPLALAPGFGTVELKYMIKIYFTKLKNK